MLLGGTDELVDIFGPFEFDLGQFAPGDSALVIGVKASSFEERKGMVGI
jgi:hypothetical protein